MIIAARSDSIGNDALASLGKARGVFSFCMCPGGIIATASADRMSSFGNCALSDECDKDTASIIRGKYQTV